ncbi:hypothetical protein LR69_03206 [Geobacillus sp. BCO2]|nr:hypothetical protein LR69_03206 [Geobacillus sp. BCO2]
MANIKSAIKTRENERKAPGSQRLDEIGHAYGNQEI